MRAMMLTIKNRQDWSTGAARAFGSAVSEVTAIIPEANGDLQPRTVSPVFAGPSGIPEVFDNATTLGGLSTDSKCVALPVAYTAC